MESTNKMTTRSYRLSLPPGKLLNILLCTAIVIIFWYLPPVAPLTVIGMRVIGIFIATVILLSVVDTVWPSMLALILMAASGVATLSQAIAGSLGSWITYFVLMSFIMTHALNESGFTNRLVAKFISIPWVGSSPWRFTFSLGFLGLLLGCFMDQIIATAFMLSFLKTVYNELGYQQGDDYPKIANIVAVFGVNIGGAMTPISHSLIILGLGIYEGITGQTVSLFSFLAFGVPTGVVLFIGLCIALRILTAPDFSHFASFDVRKVVAKQEKMDLKEKIVVFIFFGTVIMWLLPGVLLVIDPEGAFTRSLNSFGMTFWAILSVVLMAIIHIDKKPLINIKEVVNHHINWGILLFISIGVYLGSAISAPTTGMTAFVEREVVPLLATSSPLMIVVIVAGATVLLTNFASNVTTITVMTGVGVTLAVTTQLIHPLGIAMVTSFCGSAAFLLPSSFGTVAMLHGDEFSAKGEIYKFALLLMAFTVVVVVFVGYMGMS